VLTDRDQPFWDQNGSQEVPESNYGPPAKRGPSLRTGNPARPPTVLYSQEAGMTNGHSRDSVLSVADFSELSNYRPRVRTGIPSTDAATTNTPWITPRDAAAYLGVHVETIYDACNAGGLKHSRLGRRTIRLKREWLDAWVDEHAFQAK
jgi:excisionase family DNA binding protein